MRLGVFLVTSPKYPQVNVIVSAVDHTTAKRLAESVFKHDPDTYTVETITPVGKRTVFITVTEPVISE